MNRLQLLRTRYAISRLALSQEMHVHESTVWRWEHGAIPCDAMKYGPTLAAIFDTPFEEIFPDSGVAIPVPPPSGTPPALWTLRQQRRLSRHALATVTGLPYLTLYRLEYHREACSAAQAEVLAKAFPVPALTFRPQLGEITTHPWQEQLALATEETA
jgi:transcriptional regulator with XRE-family HTH domain